MTRILLASVHLRDCSETEVATIETAIGLMGRGHDVAIFASPGANAEKLRNTGIRIVGERFELDWQPDVIQSSYVFQSLELAAMYPDVPQVFVCRDADGWHSAPPRLSLVRCWGALDNQCAVRIREESLDRNAEVEWVANALDLNHFPVRPSLPLKPGKAAVFAERDTHLPAVREACQSWFLPLDEIDAATSNVAQVADTLAGCDIVIATARRALEALALGCSVILADHRGFAGLVTHENVENWRRANFSGELLTEATTTPLLVDAIRSYNAAWAVKASDWIRQRVGMESCLEQLERMYDVAMRAERDAATPLAKTLSESASAYQRALSAKQFGVRPTATFEEACEGLVSAACERALMSRQLEASDNALRKALHVERQMHQRLRQLTANVKRLEKEAATLKRKPTATSNVASLVSQTVVGKWWRWKWKKKTETKSNDFFGSEG